MSTKTEKYIKENAEIIIGIQDYALSNGHVDEPDRYFRFVEKIISDTKKVDRQAAYDAIIDTLESDGIRGEELEDWRDLFDSVHIAIAKAEVTNERI